MKKLLSIALIAIFSFNLGGYYVFFWALNHSANQELTMRLDTNNYSAEETIELKVPLTLPYPILNNGFERIDGKFEHNGEIYRLVKQKLTNDTLYIIAYQDKHEQQLSTEFKKFSRLSNDLPANGKTSSGNLLNKLIKDFSYTQLTGLSGSIGWCLNPSWNEAAPLLSSIASPVLSPPPKA